MTPAVEKLMRAARRAQALGSIGYRIGEADMRIHDTVAARWREIEDEIEDQLAAAISAVEAEEREGKDGKL